MYGIKGHLWEIMFALSPLRGKTTGICLLGRDTFFKVSRKISRKHTVKLLYLEMYLI